MEISKIKQVILEYQDFIKNLHVKRRAYFLEKEGNYVIIGPRRSGKTYFLYQTIQALCAQNDSYEEVVFLNFEDERFLEFTHHHFDSILQAYRELFDPKPILFFDEIHIVTGWEKFVRRLADTGFRVFVTGSNAEMLSTDIASTLGGRFLIKEMLPLSFREYLQFREQPFHPNDLYSEKSISIKRTYLDFLTDGAFPETLLFQEKGDYLRNLYQKLLYGDIMLRHQIRNDKALRLLVKKVAESIGDESSYRRMANLVSSTGVKVGPNTIAEYLGFFQDAYLIFGIPNFTSKFSEKESKKKYYFIDNGLLNLFLFQNESALLENLVFVELYRRYRESVFFYRKEFELDFYLPKTKTVFQVAYSLQRPETLKREVRAINSIAKKLEVQEAYILTHEEEFDIKEASLLIQVVPVWKWLLREA